MDCLFVVFGITGDLSKRKLIPAMYKLLEGKVLTSLAVVGVGRSEVKKEDILNSVVIKDQNREIWQQFCSSFYYFPFDFTKAEGFQRLYGFVKEIQKKHQLSEKRIFHLATLPDHFITISTGLIQSGLAKETASSWCRIVYEKPFGKDLISAQEINQAITSLFKEEQIYRLDHYLGKEIVGNIALVRFTNRILEPLWNNDHLESVQIILNEKLSLEGRGHYYDSSGALKDMVQSHMLQIAALLAMETPRQLTGDFIRDEKVKVLQRMKVGDVLLGQYEGYMQEKGVLKNSSTETFAAVQLDLDTPRWKGVPFYLKTGKFLNTDESSIHVKFKMVECLLTEHCPADSNYLTIKIRPEESIAFEMNVKAPGALSRVTPITLQFSYAGRAPEAYETLLSQVIEGDQSLFVRRDEIEASWKIVDSIQKKNYPVYHYAQGSTGPKELQEWSKKHHFHWRA